MLVEAAGFDGIFVDNDPATMLAATHKALQKLDALATGHDLLRLIVLRCAGVGSGGKDPSAGFRRCVIRRGPCTLSKDNWATTLAYPAHSPEVALDETRSNMPDTGVDAAFTMRRKVPGTGFSRIGHVSHAVAQYDPLANYTNVIGLPTPAWLALGHELIHCLHYLSGDTNSYTTEKRWEAGDTYIKHEEARTVGLGIYANTRISENALRREAGLPLRTFYNTPGDCDGLTSAIKA